MAGHERDHVIPKLQVLLQGMSDDEQLDALAMVNAVREGSRNPLGFFGSLLGITAHFVARGHIRCEMPVSKKLFNPHGILHGGALFSLVDYAMGGAVISLFEQMRGERFATVEVKINYLERVTGGRLVADAQVVSEGNRLIVLEARVEDDDGHLVTLASGTFYIYRHGAANEASPTRP